MARSNCWRIVCSMRSTWNCSISYTKRIYSWRIGDVSPRRRNVSSWNDPSSLGNSRPPCNGMRNCSVNAQKLSKESPYTLSPPISIPLPRISAESDAASDRRRAHSMRLLDMKIYRRNTRSVCTPTASNEAPPFLFASRSTLPAKQHALHLTSLT